ncbi:MAG: transposase, partial [Defluviitaleaceae bacterium]|nr:transposase [Defluviitaleaceae bacterium]
MKRKAQSYNTAFKSEAVKLAEKIGTAKAAAELKVPESTLFAWKAKHKQGKLVLDVAHQPKEAMKLSEEVM